MSIASGTQEGERATAPLEKQVLAVVDKTHDGLTAAEKAAARFPPAATPLIAPTAFWTVLQTKSRQEKALAGDMKIKGVEHYLPLIKKTQFYGGRRFVVDLPLFPGYLFLYGSVEEIYWADRTRRVAKIIEVRDQSQIEQELKNLRLAVDGSELLLPYPYLKKGVRVEVRSGPFRGLQGLVEQRSGAQRLILQIEMLGRAVSMEIGAAELEVID